jgi:hypothetical protein
MAQTSMGEWLRCDVLKIRKEDVLKVKFVQRGNVGWKKRSAVVLEFFPKRQV